MTIEVNPMHGNNLQDYLLQCNISRSTIPSLIFGFANAIITSLKNRFSDRELYLAMRIYDPQQLPVDNKDLIDYGELKRCKVIQHFSSSSKKRLS